MDPSTPEPPTDALADEALIRATYKSLLRAWNRRDASAFAAHFIEDGAIVGFDGSVVDGREAIGQHIGAIFASHETPAYVQYIQWVRFLSPDLAITYGVAGMPSLATGEINPTLNSVQMITLWRQADGWRIALFQNTPAQLHGRPEEVERMTQELQRRLNDASD